MFNKFVTYITLLFFVLTPTIATATSMTSAFNGLVDATHTTNQGGRFQAGARQVYTAGGADLRFGTPSTGVVLFSVTPPRINAGCGGISMFFGGFSFISGEQFQDLIKNIVQGSLGYVAHLALKTLCPMCEAVLQLMTRLSQMAAKGALDGCRIGYDAMEKIMERGGLASGSPSGGGTQMVCGNTVSSNNEAKSFLDAVNDTCNDAKKIWDNITKELGMTPSQKGPATGKADPAKLKDLISKGIYGNLTWYQLQQIVPSHDTADGSAIPSKDAIATRLFLMNMLGVYKRTDRLGAGVDTRSTKTAVETLTDPKASGQPITDSTVKPDATSKIYTPVQEPTPEGKSPVLNETGVAEYFAPLISPKEAVQLMMCGMEQNNTVGTGKDAHVINESYAKIANSWCRVKLVDETKTATSTNVNFALDNLQKPVWDCAGTDDTRYLNCLEIVAKPLQEVKFLTGKGMAFQVQEALVEAAMMVRNKEPLVTGTLDAKGKPVNHKALALIEAVDYPLYQLINLAAVYPSVSVEMLTNLSWVIGMTLTTDFLGRMLSEVPATVDPGSSGVRRGANEAYAYRIMETMTSLRVKVMENKDSISRNLVVNQHITAIIKDLNKTVQQQVMQEGLLGQKYYSDAILSGVGGNLAQPAAKKGTK